MGKYCVTITLMQEKELVDQCKRGDLQAFDQLVALYRAKIQTHCLGLVHDEESAQDLTQEAFLHAFQHLNQFRMESSFYTWVYRIAHNLSLNYLKKRKRLNEQELQEESVIAPEERSDQSVAIEALLEELPPKQREICRLAWLQNLSQKEIAAQLDIPYGTVRSRLCYARKKMRLLRPDLFQ